MPGYLLHVGATVMCMHAGQAQPTVTNPRVKVSGQPIVTQAASYMVAGCGLTGTPNPPCATAQWIVAATRVLSGGVPVLLQDSQAICTPTGTGLNILLTQMRAKGI
ncbi:hypothetical protein [Methanothrix soehngenii]|jgi:hypothetical protein|uniref:hypothetical protein n=1 Tax=Methanothrix soehngenii TaxID=2223 RepID=UPI0009CFB45F|nr:MAG: hypothetical protein A4E49_00181 [Methanosaeta sp. PtaU1.Bin112]HOE45820.1 hypothetical protein [Methanothrix soehngenii]HOS22415.1 hypothetical protein [Methanothrix soehngenii]HPL20783.1 hypothetical protein [Methanothrix soehngenii]